MLIKAFILVCYQLNSLCLSFFTPGMPRNSVSLTGLMDIVWYFNKTFWHRFACPLLCTYLDNTYWRQRQNCIKLKGVLKRTGWPEQMVVNRVLWQSMKYKVQVKEETVSGLKTVFAACKSPFIPPALSTIYPTGLNGGQACSYILSLFWDKETLSDLQRSGPGSRRLCELLL